MKQTTSGPVSPSANLCIGKSRIKRYNNAGELPTYYLQKGPPLNFYNYFSLGLYYSISSDIY